MTLTNVLLLTALVSLVSNSLTEVRRRPLQVAKRGRIRATALVRRRAFSKRHTIASHRLIRSPGHGSCSRRIPLPSESPKGTVRYRKALTAAVFHLRSRDKHQHQVDLFHATTKPRILAAASTPALDALGRCSTYQDSCAEGDSCPIRRPDLDLRKIAAAVLTPNLVSIGKGSILHKSAPQFRPNGRGAKEGSEQVVPYWFVGAYQDSTSKE